MGTRIALGRDFSFSSRSYGWLTKDAVELDEVDGYDVTRRRVLLDEVLLVTLHRARRAGPLVAWGVCWAMFAWPMLLPKLGTSGIAAFALISSPFGLAFVLHLLLGTDYVTIFGRRSRARVAFNFRKGRAREVFELVVREVEAAQSALRPAAAPVADVASGEAPPPAGAISGA